MIRDRSEQKKREEYEEAAGEALDVHFNGDSHILYMNILFVSDASAAGRSMFRQ